MDVLSCDRGNARYIYDKLDRLNKDLQHWNHHIFGNIFDKLTTTKLMQRLEAEYKHDPSSDSRTLYQATKAGYNKAAKIELMFWEQKARVKWLKSGDANTSYFHNIVKDRHRR